MRRVILVSPYAGDVDRNVAYAREAMLDCLRRGEAPFASHLLYPQALDDNDPESRALGLAAERAWIAVAEAMVVYQERGLSPGMTGAIAVALKAGLTIEYRRIVRDDLSEAAHAEDRID